MDALASYSFPQYTFGERLADGTLHVIGVGASVIALVALLVIGIRNETAQADKIFQIWRHYL